MSSFYTLVKEAPTRILDPIQAQVVESLINKLGLRKFFGDKGENINITSDRETVSVYNNEDDSNRLDTDYRLNVNVTTALKPDVDQFMSTSFPAVMPSSGMSKTWKNSYRQVFLDPEVGFSAQEVTVPCTMTFEFEFIAPEYEAALHLMGWLTNRTTEGSVNEVHDLVYSYPLDGEILAAIYCVYKLRNTWKAQNPDACHLFDYVRYITQSQWGFETRNPNLRFDTDNEQFANEWQAALTRTQLSCLGVLNADDTQIDGVGAGAEDANVAFTVKFSYKVLFGRPHMLEFTMPPVVEQQGVIPTLFKNEEKSTNLNLAGAYSNLAFNKPKLWMNKELYRKQLLTRYPKYDDWTVPVGSMLNLARFLPFIIGITTIDQIGSPTSLKITDFPGIVISPFVLDILQMHNKYDILNQTGLFNITVFSNNYPLDPKFIDWDPQTLTLSFTGDRVCNVYRVVVSEATVFDRMDRKWAQVIADNRWYFPMSIITNLNYLISTGAMKLGGGNKLTNLIRGLRNSDQLSRVIEAMITAGAAEHIWSFTQTDGQFAAYLCSEPFVPPFIENSENPMSILDVRITSLFDLFIQACLALNLCTQSMVPELQVLATNTEPYQVTNGGLLNGFNVPLRVFYDTITARGGDCDQRVDGRTEY